jgi:hypothetical protein
MTLSDQARAIDRRLNAARTVDEMRDAVHARRLIRAALEFEHALTAYEHTNPVPAAIRESFPHLIR